MLGKLAIAAVVVVCAAVPLSQVNYRELYNEMYPVNGLKRDVLGLCTATKATFVRALREDRVGCYDSMPDKLELAIGWVRTTDRPALMQAPTAVQLAEKFLAEAAVRQQLGLAARPVFTGYVGPLAGSHPCQVTALTPVGVGFGNPLTEPNARLAQRIAKGDDAALAAMGLVRPNGKHGLGADRTLPVLPLTGTSAERGAALSYVPSATLGLSGTAQAAGCGSRA